MQCPDLRHGRRYLRRVPLTLEDGVFEVKATAGETHLGARTLTTASSTAACDLKRKDRGKDLAGNQRTIRRLRTQGERVKRTLSISIQATIEIDSLFEGIDYSCSLSRARFEELCMNYLGIPWASWRGVCGTEVLNRRTCMAWCLWEVRPES